MRVDAECSCGAKLTVGFEASKPFRLSDEHATADKLLEQFRRDHKVCRLSKAATEGAVT